MTAEVARKMVEKAGIDVDKLLELLIKNAAAELTTYYYYTRRSEKDCRRCKNRRQKSF